MPWESLGRDWREMEVIASDDDILSVCLFVLSLEFLLLDIVYSTGGEYSTVVSEWISELRLSD